jgi:CheY-like chemotaxis protein
MSAADFHHLKVLIVEDNPHMRMLLRALLLSLGVNRFSEATDGMAAFEELKNGHVDFIITDLSMKPVDGIAFTRMVRQESSQPFVPIIMVTGHTERSRVEAARDAGVTEFLAKPITAHNLFRRVAEIVQHPRSFVRCGEYFGPNRRRRKAAGHTSPLRRKDDFDENVVLV